MPGSAKLRSQIEKANSFENAVQVLYTKHRDQAERKFPLKIGITTQQVLYDKFFTTPEKEKAVEILSTKHTLSLQWLIALGHCKAQYRNLFTVIAEATKTAIKRQVESSDLNEIMILDLLNSLSISSSTILFEITCLQVKRLLKNQLPDVINAVSDHLENAIKAFEENTNSPLLKRAAIKFVKEILHATQKGPLDIAGLNSSFNKKQIAHKTLENFIFQQHSFDGEQLVLVIDALTSTGETSKVEDQISALYLSKKEFADLSLEHINQALNIILRSACSKELASTLTAGLVSQVKKITPKEEEAKTFLSQLNSLAVYGKEGEKSTTWIIPMVNAIARYVENDYRLVEQLLFTANEQKVLFRQVQQQSASPRAASSSSPKASSSQSPTASPSTSPPSGKFDLRKKFAQARDELPRETSPTSPRASSSQSPTENSPVSKRGVKSTLEEQLAILNDQGETISADFIVTLFRRLSAIPKDELVANILKVLPTRIKEVDFSCPQIKELLLLFPLASRDPQIHLVGNILSIVDQWLETNPRPKEKQEVYLLLTSLPVNKKEKEKKAEIVEKLRQKSPGKSRDWEYDLI